MRSFANIFNMDLDFRFCAWDTRTVIDTAAATTSTTAASTSVAIGALQGVRDDVPNTCG